jgi:hypothetical protein
MLGPVAIAAEKVGEKGEEHHGTDRVENPLQDAEYLRLPIVHLPLPSCQIDDCTAALSVVDER